MDDREEMLRRGAEERYGEVEERYNELRRVKGEFDGLLREIARVYVEGVGEAQGKGDNRRLRKMDTEGVLKGLGEVEREYIEGVYGKLEESGGENRGLGARRCEIL